MLLFQFSLENLHFALNIFAAFVFFSVSWLYFDAWREVKQKKELYKIAGFLVVALSFLIHAVYLEQFAISGFLLNGPTINLLSNVLGILGYILIIVGQIVDPIQPRPVTQTLVPSVFLLGTGLISATILPILLPILTFIVFLLYLRRSTQGLENHLKPLTFGFLFIFVYYLLSLSNIFESTDNINVYNFVQPFGILWLISHLFLLLGILVIAKWVFKYLLERLQTQMFMILNVLTLFIFMVVTVAFTTLLINSYQTNALSSLDTDVRVVGYAISAKQNQAISDAEVISQNSDLQKAMGESNKDVLKNIATSVIVAKKQSYLVIANTSGAVLMRGEDSDRMGDSVSSDPLFVRALRGEKVSSVVLLDGAIAPKLSIRSAVPVKSQDKTIGVIIVGTDIDNAFVDGLKETTKLNISVYAGNTLSATTFTSIDGKSRYIGVKEENGDIRKKVLNEGKNYPAVINILNVPYYGVFAPLKDVNSNPVGMIFAGKEQTLVIEDGAKSIEITFVIASILILISFIPAFYISKYISNQFK